MLVKLRSHRRPKGLIDGGWRDRLLVCHSSCSVQFWLGRMHPFLILAQTTIYLADINDLPKENEIYRQYFVLPAPGRAVVEFLRCHLVRSSKWTALLVISVIIIMAELRRNHVNWHQTAVTRLNRDFPPAISWPLVQTLWLQQQAHPVPYYCQDLQWSVLSSIYLEFSLGRDPKSSVFLNDATVSNHATIDLSNLALGYATIEDLDSFNGTCLGRWCRINKATLRDGSWIVHAWSSTSRVSA